MVRDYAQIMLPIEPSINTAVGQTRIGGFNGVLIIIGLGQGAAQKEHFHSCMVANYILILFTTFDGLLPNFYISINMFLLWKD